MTAWADEMELLGGLLVTQDRVAFRLVNCSTHLCHVGLRMYSLYFTKKANKMTVILQVKRATIRRTWYVWLRACHQGKAQVERRKEDQEKVRRRLRCFSVALVKVLSRVDVLALAFLRVRDLISISLIVACFRTGTSRESETSQPPDGNNCENFQTCSGTAGRKHLKLFKWFVLFWSHS